MTGRYLRLLSLRKGETYARMKHDRGGPVALVTVGARALANTAAAAALMHGLKLFGRPAHHHYLVLMLRNIGKLRYIAGFPPIELYARPFGSPGNALPTPLKVP
jgi:hypothetical protein